LAEVIAAKVEVGLSARRIYQDLVEQNDFSDSYQSVKRFVRKLRATQPERVWRAWNVNKEDAAKFSAIRP
jgi:hypothetical protein